jgi:hypothetical protein
VAVTEQKLQGLTGAEFTKAERHFRWASRLQVLVTLVAAASVFITSGAASLVAGSVSLALFAGWAWHDWSYRDCRAQAERGRRALWIADGLGDRISREELRDVEAGFHITAAQGEAAENPEFFASKRPAGDARLTELMEESGFYSCRLYRHSARWAWGIFALSGAVAFGLLLSAVVLASAEQAVTVARLVSTGLVFFIGAEVLGAARGYTRAYEGLASWQARVRAVRAKGYPSGDLLLLFTDYNSAVESAPMMAPGVYKKHAADLDRMWRRHLEAQA